MMGNFSLTSLSVKSRFKSYSDSSSKYLLYFVAHGLLFFILSASFDFFVNQNNVLSHFSRIFTKF